MYGRILKSLNIVNLYRGMSKLKLKINVNVPQLPQMSIASKAAFLENYLGVSAWILNGSSIECHNKKRQPFSLSGVRFGSRAILISG